MPKPEPHLPELVRVTGGKFLMGAPETDRFANDTERPVHPVEIKPFAIGKLPVTVAQYRCYQPTHAEKGDEDFPVVSVNWQEAQGYCAWLTSETQRHYRLPSEAEWEYACRAGSAEAFSFGDDVTPEAANFLFDEQGRRVGRGALTPAGSFPPNAFGIHEMHGNICEWVADAWHPNYFTAPNHGEAWEGTAEDRVIRGGAWDYMPRLLRSAWRDHLPSTTKRDNVGFRVAADEPDPPET